MGNLGWAEIVPYVVAGAITLWALVFGLIWYKSRAIRRALQESPDEASDDDGHQDDTSEDDDPT